jgi:hypothetical protein
MALTQREKMIAIGVAAVIGCYGVWTFGIESYIDKRAELVNKRDDAKKQLEDADRLQAEREARRPVWDYMRNSGLDSSLADSRLGQMLEAWAADSRRPPGANFRITGGNQSRGSAGGGANNPLTANGFTELKVQVQAEGNQKGLAWILWNLERVNVPVKVNQTSVKPRTEGRDDLKITLNLSTLALAPAPGRTP